MFDTAEAADSSSTAALVAASFRAMVEHETRLLAMAAHWADLHAAPPGGDWSLDPLHLRLARPTMGAVRVIGGVGTPEVWEAAAAELGALQATTTQAATAQMADALDLRHRLPRLWHTVQTGGVRAWKARFVAKSTRHLSLAAAAYVDQSVTDQITALPWGRFQDHLDAKIYEADHRAAEHLHALKAAERYVTTGRSNEYGLMTLIARANAGDVIWFRAMVNRIAEILAAEGDAETVDVRRSKAIGILAQPAVALDLLARHQRDPDTHPQTKLAPVDEEPAGQDHTSIRFDPADPPAGRLDVARLRPPVTLYLHLSAEALLTGRGVVRMEEVGPVLLSRVKELLGSQAQIRLQPVIDPADSTPADSYEIPRLMRERVRLRNPVDIFPWGTTRARGCDLDHTTPFLATSRGGPPGQTSVDNLGPLSRGHHRAKTLAGWRLRQPEPGIFIWRSPNGWIYRVDHQGTHALGNNAFAHAIWNVATVHQAAAERVAS